MNYAEIAVPGLAMPLLQFIRGEAQQLTLELFIDSSDRKSLAPQDALRLASSGEGEENAVDLTANSGVGITPVPPDQWEDLGASPFCEHRLAALRRIAEIDSHLHAPNVVLFSWSAERFQGVVTSMTEKFTMFDENGNIVRARVSLTLKSWMSAEEQFQNINPQSPDRTKTYVVQAGDRLDAIAAAEYGDPEKWPVIARANNIVRPRILTPGALLVIPPLA
jgi:nucleoid-associated protein YgaU